MRLFLCVISLIIGCLPVPAGALPMPAPRDHWECVPFARAVSGVQIYGDALTWWGQAEGRYRRGNKPRLGAVLTFIPHGKMELGHVATVSRIIDARTVLVTHANWSPIDGRRGQIERDVEVIDVSDAGDWSAVRVWFAPSQGLGSTAWPTYGFIYPTGKPVSHDMPAAQKPVWAEKDKSASAMPKPTGRLAYLAKLLPKLK